MRMKMLPPEISKRCSEYGHAVEGDESGREIVRNCMAIPRICQEWRVRKAVAKLV